MAKKLPLSLLLAIPLVVSACGGQPQETAPSAAAPTPSHSAPATMPASSAAPAEAKKSLPTPPAPPEVLREIYLQDSQGKDSMDIANGSVASYWYGLQFDLKGKHYFTGFVTDTPEKYGKQPDSYLPAPDAKVTLTEATFERTAEQGGTWKFVGGERYIGEFGGREQPNVIDEKRQTVSYETPDGQFLLAIPTWDLEQGTRLKLWDVFVFNPGQLKDVEDTHWTYIGTLAAGADNSAACDQDGGPLLCVDSIGALSFVSQDGGAMPLVRIQFSGTDVDDQGKKRTLGASDVKTYRYDAAKKTYADGR